MVATPAPIEAVQVAVSESLGYSLLIVSGLPGGCVKFNGYDLDRDGNLIKVTVTNLTPSAPVPCTAIYGRHDGELALGTDPLNPDTDGDGVNDGTDIFPLDSSESVDTDGDGTGDHADLDDDGWVDIYVANDAYPNHLWLNQRDGTFREAALMMGAAYNLHGQPEAGMGVVAADFDNDSRLDLFVTHLRVETNTHYRNLGGGVGFDDVTGETGLAASSMEYTGFGTAALDVELDGDLDLVVANGRVNRVDPLPDASIDPPWNLLAEPNLFYLNDGRGRFELIERPVASLCGLIEITRGLAIGDIDSDGDVDILISNVQGPARLYRNTSPRNGHWLVVRATDLSLRRDAIGARITVLANGQRQVRTITRGFGYLSSSDPRAHFGLGDVERVDRIEVRWPDGARESFPATEFDRFVQVTRGTGKRQP